jgi:hypothetical protein
MKYDVMDRMWKREFMHSPGNADESTKNCKAVDLCINN